MTLIGSVLCLLAGTTLLLCVAAEWNVFICSFDTETTFTDLSIAQLVSQV